MFIDLGPNPIQLSSTGATILEGFLSTRLNLLLFIDKIFKDHAIDGETLPLLTEEHLLDTMGLKLGPALKIRCQVRLTDIMKFKIFKRCKRCVVTSGTFH